MEQPHLTNMPAITDAENKRGAKTLSEKLGLRTVKLFPRYRKPLGV